MDKSHHFRVYALFHVPSKQIMQMNTPINQDLLVANAIAVDDSAKILFLTVDSTLAAEQKLAGKTFQQAV